MKIKRDFFLKLMGKFLTEDETKSQIQIANSGAQMTCIIPTDLANQFSLNDKIKITLEKEE